jgi:hypothetical protein
MTNWLNRLFAGKRKDSRSARYVFVSYVSDDVARVHEIRRFLERMGINVWMDKTSLLAGQGWRDQLRRAITEATFFLACFSDKSVDRESTYMDEELAIALDVLRTRRTRKSWFIPLRLDDCQLPSGGRLDLRGLLAELQWIDGYTDFTGGLRRLADVVVPELLPEELARSQFESAVELHIQRKIEHYRSIRAPLRPDILAKWLAFAEADRLKSLSESFSECHRRAMSTERPEFDMFPEPQRAGCVVLLSAVPHKNLAGYLRSLPVEARPLKHEYLDFLIGLMPRFRLCQDWEERDFLHIIHFDDRANDEVTVDMLFLESLRSRSLYVGQVAESQGYAGSGMLVLQESHMYPTSLLTAVQAGALWDFVYQDHLLWRDRHDARSGEGR